MTKERLPKSILTASTLLLLLVSVFAQEPVPTVPKNTEKKEKKKEPSLTDLRIEVTSGPTATPVGSAEVFASSEEEGARFIETTNTNNRGVGSLLGVPRGKLFVLVTADGYKPNRNRFELKQPKETIKVTLEKLPDPSG